MRNSIVDGATILGTLIAIATFMFVLSDWFARKRRVRDITWNVVNWGNEPLAANPARYGVSITNAGDENAMLESIHIFRAKAMIGSERPLKTWVIMPGSTIDLTIETTSVQEAWILLEWVSPANVSRIWYEWFPVARDTKLTAERQRTTAKRRNPITGRMRVKRNAQVAPGHQRRSYVTAQDLKSGKDIQPLLSMKEEQLIHSIYPDIASLYIPHQ
jgi:hypothetical protein